MKVGGPFFVSTLHGLLLKRAHCKKKSSSRPERSVAERSTSRQISPFRFTSVEMTTSYKLIVSPISGSSKVLFSRLNLSKATLVSISITGKVL